MTASKPAKGKGSESKKKNTSFSESVHDLYHFLPEGKPSRKEQARWKRARVKADKTAESANDRRKLSKDQQQIDQTQEQLKREQEQLNQDQEETARRRRKREEDEYYRDL